MKFFAALKLLLDLRKGWSSRTVIVNRVLSLIGVIDVTTFQGEIGGKIVDGVMWLLMHQPIFMFTREQVISALVVIVASVYQWLRVTTSGPIAK